MTNQVDPIADAFALLVETKPVAAEDPSYVYNTFREVFDSPAGRRVMVWICQHAGVFPPGEDAMVEDGLRSAAGRRYLALWILRHYAIPPPAPKPEQKPVPPLDRR